MFEQWPLILAQEDPAPGGGSPPPSAPPASETGGGTLQKDGENQELGEKEQTTSPFGGSMMWVMAGVLLLVWIFIFSGPRREKKKRAEMIASLDKNATVQTIGGVIGTVVEVNDKDIVLKVDEASNTRMRFSRGAIQQVLDSKKDN